MFNKQSVSFSSYLRFYLQVGIVLLVSLFSCAVLANGYMDNTVPRQSFQVAEGDSSWNDYTDQSTVSVPKEHSTTQIVKAPQGISAISNQLQNISLNNQRYREKAAQTLQILAQQNHSLQIQLTQLTQVVGSLNQEIIALKGQVEKNHEALFSSMHQNLNQWIATGIHIFGKTGISILAFGLLVLLILLVWLIFAFCSFKNKKQTVSPAAETPVQPGKKPDTDAEDEYDFINSQEGIAAKLDLAQAYLAMGNDALAKEVLEDVLASGDSVQKAKATELMKKIHN